MKDDSIPAPLTDALKSTLAKKASQIMDHDKHHNRSRLPNDQLGSLMQSERLQKSSEIVGPSQLSKAKRLNMEGCNLKTESDI